MPRTLVISLLVMAGALAWIAGVPAMDGAPGAPHPRIPGMRVGGDPGRSLELLWPAFGFGIGSLGAGVALIALGLRPAARRRALPWVAAGMLLQTAVFTAVVIAYRDELGAAEPVVVLGLPLATAWMLWALWPAPILFVALWVLRFEDWILGPEDARRFEEILARRRARRSRGGEG